MDYSRLGPCSNHLDCREVNGGRSRGRATSSEPTPGSPCGTPAETDMQLKSGNSTQDPIKALDELDLSYVQSSHKDGIRQLLLEFTTIWDGSLSEIKITEQRIDLLPYTKPFSQLPYMAGSKPREDESILVERLL